MSIEIGVTLSLDEKAAANKAAFAAYEAWEPKEPFGFLELSHMMNERIAIAIRAVRDRERKTVKTSKPTKKK